ncbi:MAG: GIN domain-containing protein, partial [Chryseobacterium taeanense]
AVFNIINNINENSVLVDLSSGSVVNGNFNISDNTKVEVSSGAVINSTINSKQVNIKASSGAVANLNGNVNTGSIDVSSGAVCNAGKFQFNDLEVEATSGAAVTSHVVSRLKATASSGGTIKYKGEPKVDSNISKTSGGSLKQIN